jgi:hypothetical protein
MARASAGPARGLPAVSDYYRSVWRRYNRTWTRSSVTIPTLTMCSTVARKARIFPASSTNPQPAGRAEIAPRYSASGGLPVVSKSNNPVRNNAKAQKTAWELPQLE